MANCSSKYMVKRRRPGPIKKDRLKAGLNSAASGGQGIAQWAPIDWTKIVCLISAIRLGVANAYRVDSRRFGSTARCPRRPRTSQSDRISKATEAPPRIAGRVIKKSRTRPVPAAILSTWKGQTRPIIVDVDTVAAGDAQTYSYMCVITQGSAFVQRTMN
jgi:hypothetical protein